LDVKLFNTQVKNLINKKEVIIPTYNFITGEKEFKRQPVTMNDNEILMEEFKGGVKKKVNKV